MPTLATGAQLMPTEQHHAPSKRCMRPPDVIGELIQQCAGTVDGAKCDVEVEGTPCHLRCSQGIWLPLHCDFSIDVVSTVDPGRFRRSADDNGAQANRSGSTTASQHTFSTVAIAAGKNYLPTVSKMVSQLVLNVARRSFAHVFFSFLTL